MTFKDLKKKVALEATRQQTKLYDRLLNTPFWIWDQQQHKLDVRTNGDCCFNHIIGLPKKMGMINHSMTYEQIIFNSLVTQSAHANKHLWIKKATGLGISEFMMRFMAWLCLEDDKLSGSQMCIVTGPRIDLAIALIDRIKKVIFI